MSGGGKRGMGSAPAAIPAGSRKIVQSLKEIVNCPEAEIYAMLKECNMDPSEAVHRLLTQDTFQEVKSKRDKKKEPKDTPDSRSRSVSNNQHRVARGGTDRGGRASSNQSNSYDYGASHAKPAHKKENGTSTGAAHLIAGSGTGGSNLNQRPTTFCEAVPVQNTTQVPFIADGPSLPSQPPSGFQHNWSRVPGQPSMADIVRMGRPQSKTSNTPLPSDKFHKSHDPVMSNVSHQSAMLPSTTITPSESAQVFHSSQSPMSGDEGRSDELGTGAGHYISHDDWSLVGETSAGSGSTRPEISGASVHADPSKPSSLLPDEANLEQERYLDENQLQEEDVNGDCIPPESISSGSISDGQEEDNTGNSTHLDDDPLNDMSHHSHLHSFEHCEVEDVNEKISLATTNMQQLSLQKEDFDTSTADDKPAVIIPSHLQVMNDDFSQLSFGSFGSGVNAAPSGPFPSKPLGTNLEMAPVAEDIALNHLNSRNPECYDGEQLKSTLNDGMTSITNTNTRSYDMPSASQPENVSNADVNAAHGLQENFPPISGYDMSATTQPTATYAYTDPNSQMHNLSPFSSIMQPNTNPLPNNLPSSLLAQSGQPLQEFDLPFSSLLAATRYNTTLPTVSGSISVPEVKPETQQNQQALPGSNIHNSSGSQHPQHLIHPYSQPTLPLGHFANMISYPFLPQSYTFLPSAAFQQAAYTSNSPFHQSPAAAAAAAAAAMKYSTLLPQYKSNISGSSLPQSLALPPGYGDFTSVMNNIGGNFSLNPSTATASTTMGFEEALSSQYKEGSQYPQLQHNENPTMWVHGAGSRTVSAFPGNTFYGFQGQQRQQQQLSLYGQMGHLNLYQSQGGQAQEQQQHQQNPTEGNLSGGSQGPASHNQIWQHGY